MLRNSNRQTTVLFMALSVALGVDTSANASLPGDKAVTRSSTTSSAQVNLLISEGDSKSAPELNKVSEVPAVKTGSSNGELLPAVMQGTGSSRGIEERKAGENHVDTTGNAEALDIPLDNSSVSTAHGGSQLELPGGGPHGNIATGGTTSTSGGPQGPTLTQQTLLPAVQNVKGDQFTLLPAVSQPRNAFTQGIQLVPTGTTIGAGTHIHLSTNGNTFNPTSIGNFNAGHPVTVNNLNPSSLPPGATVPIHGSKGITLVPQNEPVIKLK